MGVYLFLFFILLYLKYFFFFQAEDGIRDGHVTGVQTCALPISWSASIDDASAIAYRIYRNGTWAGTSSTTSWTNIAVGATTTYTYTVRAIDAAGNLGDASPPGIVTTPETSPPTAPAGLTAQPATSPTRVELVWQPSTDNVGVAAYEVARDGVVLATAAGTSYTDAAVAAGTTYAYAVVAVDAAGNRSAAATASVTVPDAAPTPPNLLANGSFEVDLAGWSGWQGAAARVAGGAEGGFAARVSFGGSGTAYALTAGAAVTNTVAGTGYRARAQVRSQTPGRSLCLLLRERSPSWTILGVRSVCVTGAAGWQTFPDSTTPRPAPAAYSSSSSSRAPRPPATASTSTPSA